MVLRLWKGGILSELVILVPTEILNVLLPWYDMIISVWPVMEKCFLSLFQPFVNNGWQ
jgi:hypothetical protein